MSKELPRRAAVSFMVGNPETAIRLNPPTLATQDLGHIIQSFLRENVSTGEQTGIDSLPETSEAAILYILFCAVYGCAPLA